tara:strand:- start:240 stop:452 length:213 start_codon:yes stop_codon:yes gene_type:complete
MGTWIGAPHFLFDFTDALYQLRFSSKILQILSMSLGGLEAHPEINAAVSIKKARPRNDPKFKQFDKFKEI